MRVSLQRTDRNADGHTRIRRHTDTHAYADTQTDTDTDRHTDTHRQRQTQTQTDTGTHLVMQKVSTSLSHSLSAACEMNGNRDAFAYEKSMQHARRKKLLVMSPSRMGTDALLMRNRFQQKWRHWCMQGRKRSTELERGRERLREVRTVGER